MIETEKGERFWWMGHRAFDSLIVSRLVPVELVISCDHGSDLGDYCDKVFSLEEKTSHRKNWTNHHITDAFLHGMNGDLKHELARDDKPINVVTYSSTEDLEAIAAKHPRMRILACPFKLKKYFDSKIRLREILTELSLPVIPGEVVKPKTKFEELKERYGVPFVMQKDITSAGNGTWKIGTSDSFEHIKKEYPELIVTKYSQGVTVAVHCVILANGELVFSPVHVQITGDNLLSRKVFSFCGNDYTAFKPFADATKKQVYSSVRKLAKRLYEGGWKGVINVDLLVSNGVPYIIDLNPRLSGTSQLLADLQAHKGVTPIGHYYIKAFTGGDVESTELPDYTVEGSQFILHNLEGQTMRVKNAPKHGVYKLVDNELFRVRNGHTVLDCEAPDEFVITCGIPHVGIKVDESARLCKLQSLGSFAGIDGKLNEWGRAVAEKVYSEFVMEPSP